MVQNFVQFSIYVEELVGHEEQTEYWKLGNYHVSLPLRRKLQNKVIETDIGFTI